MKRFLRLLALPLLFLGSLAGIAATTAGVASAAASCQFGQFSLSGWFGNCTQSTAAANEQIQVLIHCDSVEGASMDVYGPWVYAKGALQSDGRYPRSSASCPTDGHWVRENWIIGRYRYV